MVNLSMMMQMISILGIKEDKRTTVNIITVVDETHMQ
jgi:hypothetical protein